MVLIIAIKVNFIQPFNPFGDRSMINITLPDETIKHFEKAPTGMDVAKSISDGFASRCVALALNGALYDLSHTISEDARVRLITRDDEEAIDILRHSAAHVMAQAVLALYKDAKLTIGPVVAV